MADKQITKLRPICLYEDTCLHLKEKTRLCEDCVHHKNYWSELLEKEQLEKIKSLEQECEELKKWKENVANMFDKTCRCKYLNEENAHCSFYNKECIAINQCLYKNQQTITEIKEICNKTICDYLQCSLNYNHSKDFECEKTSCDRAKRRKFILKILQKISECEAENE